MKIRFFTLLALLCAAGAVQAQTEVSARIDKVTVYPNSALVEKSITVPLQKGENKFVIHGNSGYASSQAVHFEASAHWYVSALHQTGASVSESEQLSRMLPAFAYQQYQALQKQIDDQQLRATNCATLIQTLRTQRDALNRIRAISNTQALSSVDSLRMQFEFQRSELQKINAAVDKATREQQECTERIARLQDEKKALVRKHTGGARVNLYDYSLYFSIYSDRAVTNARIPFSYMVPNVSSHYHYDVLLDESAHRAVFALKVDVDQNTGEHWNGCPIVFSTIQAGYAGYDAQLSPYYLDYAAAARPQLRAKGALANSMVMKAAVVEDAAVAEKAEAYEDVMSTPSAASELTLAREYQLSTPQCIAFGEGSQTLLLKYDTTEAAFARYATPKNEEKVHYTALLPNWESLGLHEAPCNVYMDGRYVSNSYIRTAGSADTLRFAVGNDPNVLVQRQVKKSAPAATLLSKEVDITATVTLTVKNTKREAVSLSLKDQVPISAASDIKVTPSVGDGRLDASTGVVRWQLELKPLEQRTVTFSYTVRLPKEKLPLIHLN